MGCCLGCPQPAPGRGAEAGPARTVLARSSPRARAADTLGPVTPWPVSGSGWRPSFGSSTSRGPRRCRGRVWCAPRPGRRSPLACAGRCFCRRACGSGRWAWRGRGRGSRWCALWLRSGVRGWGCLGGGRCAAGRGQVALRGFPVAWRWRPGWGRRRWFGSSAVLVRSMLVMLIYIKMPRRRHANFRGGMATSAGGRSVWTGRGFRAAFSDACAGCLARSELASGMRTDGAARAGGGRSGWGTLSVEPDTPAPTPLTVAGGDARGPPPSGEPMPSAGWGLLRRYASRNDSCGLRRPARPQNVSQVGQTSRDRNVIAMIRRPRDALMQVGHAGRAPRFIPGIRVIDPPALHPRDAGEGRYR